MDNIRHTVCPTCMSCTLRRRWKYTALPLQWGEINGLLNSSRRNFCATHYGKKKKWGNPIQTLHYFFINRDHATGRPSVMFSLWREMGTREGWGEERMRVGVLLHCRESSWNPLAVFVLKERGVKQHGKMGHAWKIGENWLPRLMLTDLS